MKRTARRSRLIFPLALFAASLSFWGHRAAYAVPPASPPNPALFTLHVSLFTPPSGDADSKSLFNATTYADHIRYLASDELGGRKPGQPGIQKAADYISGIFKAAGCEPAGDNGTYFQEFEVTDGRKIVESEADLEIDGQALTLNKDWVPTPFNKNDSVEGQLAFAGYGIEAKDFKYDDFDGFDPKDKVLLELRYEPRAKDAKAEFGGTEKSRYSLFSTKAHKASEKGAKALLVVDPPSPDEKSELYPFRKSEVQSMDVPIAHITRETAERLLKKAGLPDLKTLQEKLESDHKSLSADMKMAVKFTPAVKPNKVKTYNVLGMLKGDGSTDEIIVVGAHYDHLGTGPKQFQNSDDKIYIHNGADDNASGSSGVCELSCAFGSQPKVRRNILFMTFSGEEMGLLGSAHFVNHPTIDLAKVRAMYNLDMIGRFGQNKFEFYGIDTAEEFEPLVKRITKEQDIEYKFMSRNSGVFAQSDHASFYRKDIPVLFPFTGVHKQYHQPEDDWELIDNQGATRVLQMSFEIIRELASMKDGPTFIKSDKKKKEETAKADAKSGDAAPVDVVKKDEKGAGKEGAKKEDDSTPAPAARARPTARMGIMPGYAEDGTAGMLVESVMETGAAAKAGMKDGDRIVKIGDTKVMNVQDYMNSLQTYKPGDSADIVVMREGKEQTLKVTFTGGTPNRRERN